MNVTIYPAIDLYEGKVVRLTKGDFAQKTVYSDFPEEMAEKWQKGGAKWIHVVDLEGAKTGILKNLKAVEAMRRKVKCWIQFGGGMRSLEAVEAAIAAGMDRVVIGTKALDGEFFRQALSRFGNRIAVGVDVKDGFVQTQGWLEASSVSLEDGIKMFNDNGVETLIYTDIQRDGMLQGPNLEKLGEVLRLSRSRIILSGGIGSIGDIEKASSINAANLDGIIVGKALYENKFTLEQALKAAGGK